MYLTLADAAAALRAGRTTSVELTRQSMAAADRCDQELGIYLSRFDDSAMAGAEKADRQMSAGVDHGPLHGIPVGVKDTVPTSEGETTAQSLVLDRVRWSGRDASVVARLRAGGAVVTGKTTVSEHSIGVPDFDKPFPVPRNPWNRAHWTGGSSSGTASGISVGAFLGGVGTDAGGSIRTPSSNCGVTGLKPTFGRVSRQGCVPFDFSYTHVGPMARSAADCASLLAAMAGVDDRDPTSVDRPVAEYAARLAGGVAGLRIGVDPLSDRADRPARELESTFTRAVGELEAAGAILVPITLPLYEELMTATMTGMCSEAFAFHRPDLRTRWDEYGAATRAALILGAVVSTGDYVQIQKVRRVGQRKVAELFDSVDLIVTPTNSAGAPRFDGLTLEQVTDGLHTAYWNAVGNPAMSVPMGFTTEGLPLGMQIAGKPFDEATVLAAGHAYQQRTDWHLRTPGITRASRDS